MKKNKWYEVLGAGLLSVSAMYLCTALVVTGCSSDNSGVTGEDPEEYSEAVVPGDEEEIEEPSSSEKEEVAETSDTEESSNSEDAVKTEKPADVDEPADTEEKSEQTESSNSEEKSEQAETLNSEETPEPAESGDVAEPEESAEPNNETESGEGVEPENDAEPNENVEPNVGKKVAQHTREWYRLRDTVSYFITEQLSKNEKALEKLEKNRYSLISRCEWDFEVEDCSMEESEFHAAYQGNEDVARKLTDAGILWDGSEWEGWNPVEDGESTVVLDTALSAWSNGRVYVHAVYRVSYHLNSDPDTEHSFLLDVPVKYMRVD